MAKFTTFYCTSSANLFIIILSMLNPSFAAPATTNYNVITFGAKPNGVADSTKAFLNAWSAACASLTATVIQVPKGRYLLHPLTFQGDCKSPGISFQIEGTIVAPADYRILGGVDDWIGFQGVSRVSIFGGAIDGNGPALWDCKASGKDCPSGATVSTETIFFST